MIIRCFETDNIEEQIDIMETEYQEELKKFKETKMIDTSKTQSCLWHIARLNVYFKEINVKELDDKQKEYLKKVTSKMKKLEKKINKLEDDYFEE